MSRYLCGFAIVVFFLALIVGCDEKPPVAPEEPGWASMGFEDHWAVELELDWPHLYACAADEGLFRTSLTTPGSEWQYLGLADTSLADTTFGHYTNRGVQDVAILSDGTILAAVKSGIPHLPGLYRSPDYGGTWVASDEGVADSSAPYASNISAVEVSPVGERDIIAVGHAIYWSGDGGMSWSLVNGRRAGTAMYNDLVLHPAGCIYTWAGGETAIFSGFLYVSTDCGHTWQEGSLTYADLADNPIYSIAADPFNPLNVIICMSRSAISSNDGGETWQDPAFEWAPNGRLWKVIFDRDNQGHFFASYSTGIFESWDSGASADTLEAPCPCSIIDLEYDAMRGSLYVGTWTGVFRYNLAVQQ